MALGDMKVQDMADTLGVNRATIGRWMHDRGAPPKRAYILQWAMATGVSVDWLEHGTVHSPNGGGGGAQQPTDYRRRDRFGNGGNNVISFRPVA